MMDKVVLAKHNKTSLKQVNQNIRLNQLLVALGTLEEKSQISVIPDILEATGRNHDSWSFIPK